MPGFGCSDSIVRCTRASHFCVRWRTYRLTAQASHKRCSIQETNKATIKKNYRQRGRCSTQRVINVYGQKCNFQLVSISVRLYPRSADSSATADRFRRNGSHMREPADIVLCCAQIQRRWGGHAVPCTSARLHRQRCSRSKSHIPVDHVCASVSACVCMCVCMCLNPFKITRSLSILCVIHIINSGQNRWRQFIVKSDIAFSRAHIGGDMYNSSHTHTQTPPPTASNKANSNEKTTKTTQQQKKRTLHHYNLYAHKSRPIEFAALYLMWRELELLELELSAPRFVRNAFRPDIISQSTE